jgi:predicted short-subunit dehydrogenase-like oxidoreductase (DUF2520 family)
LSVRTATDTIFGAPNRARIARVGIVGRGRMGTALAAALDRAGIRVDGPAGRGEAPDGDAILLCVPDAAIPEAAAAVAGAPLVGHTSGATPLSALEPAGAEERFGIHPLQAATGPGISFAGCGCAVAGSTAAALAAATELAVLLGMRPFELDDSRRAAYHAAASIASNYLVTLEAAAESMVSAAGIEPAESRALLGPLVRSTVENWITLGPERALTGPLLRGDAQTVALQRAAVAEAHPELLEMWDALAARTREIADRRSRIAEGPDR